MPADRRLDQRDEMEILGRAAVPALTLLSEQTGVSLGGASEDLNTVGERKLTIISKGLLLKGIMVQLAEALQECHWDIDDSGDKPVYLLHRKMGIDEEQRQSRPRRSGRGVRNEVYDTRAGPRRPDRAGRAPGLGEYGLHPEPPQDPALLVEVSLTGLSDLTLPAVERAIADQTGFSVISDFFEDSPSRAAQAVGRPNLALWSLLEVLAWENGGKLLVWQRAGPCLTIHHNNWYRLAKSEMPEDIVHACRDKLEKQGRLTMHDLAEAALVIAERDLTHRQFPADLRRAGMGGAVTADAWALVLYDSLSAEQQAKASSEEGLSFADLQEEQQAWVLYRSRCMPDYLPLDQAEESRLRVAESSRELPGRSCREIVVELEFPETSDMAVLLLDAGE
jgi:hypothetical protein